MKIYNKIRLALLLLLFCGYTTTEAQLNIYHNITNDTLRTNATSSVSGDKLRGVTESMFGNTLSGKIAGLTVMRNTGEPGSNAPSLYIRGRSTYNVNSKALILIDGFEGNMNNLLPEEIESVTILKDAAALAVYGIRGANGVVWITTKRGKEGRVKMNLNLKAGISVPLKTPSFGNAYEYASMYNEAISNDLGHWSPFYSESELQQYQNGSSPYFYPNVDWENEIMRRHTFYEEGNFSVQGGDSNVKYFALLGFMNTPKFYRDNTYTDYNNLQNLGQYTRYNIRSNVDVKINRVFGLKVNLSGAIEDGSSPNSDSIFDMIYNTPSNAYPVRNENNTWAANTIWQNNPAATVFASGKQSSHVRNFQTDLILTQNLNDYVEGLSFREAVSFTGSSRTLYIVNKDFSRYQMINGADGIIYNKVGGVDSEFTIDESEKTRTQMSRMSYMGEVDYQRQFAKHKIGAQLGFMYSRYVVDGDNVPYLNAGMYGRLGYVYNNRYSADFAFAYNGSENLPRKNRYGFFPSVSVGWVMSNESFLMNSHVVNFLKLRASAGMVGNSDLGNTRFGYQTFYVSTAGKYNIGTSANTSLSGLVEGRLGNPNISYEKNYKYDIGVDVTLWNALQLNVDYFYEKRNGILATNAATVPVSTAILLPYENIGKVKNQGMELTADYQKKTGEVLWGINGVFSFAKNKIDYQAEATRTESYLYRTGHSVGQYFGLEATGLVGSSDEINDNNFPFHTFAPLMPGDIKYANQNKDNIIDENDEKAIGYNDLPQINYGFGLNVGYKGFDFSADFYGQAQRSIMLKGNTVWAFYENGQLPEMAKNRWAYYPEAGIDTRNGATYPRLTTADNNNNYRNSTFWLRNGNFMRLRNIEIGYSLSKKCLHKSIFSLVRFYVSANNLFTISAMNEFDPEVLSGYPMSQSFNLGINVQF